MHRLFDQRLDQPRRRRTLLSNHFPSRSLSRKLFDCFLCVCLCVACTRIYIYATCKRIGVNLADRINLLNLQDKMFYAREKENMK